MNRKKRYGVWNTKRKNFNLAFANQAKQKQERDYLKRLERMPISIDFKLKN